METAIKVLCIAAGGSLGAVARYLVNVSPIANAAGKFPLPTFLINVTGSFLIGFCLIVLTDKLVISDNLRMGIIVGFLGAFTTFSTFEIEIYGLIRDRYFVTAFLYLFLSVIIGFAGVIAGVTAGRFVSFSDPR